MVVRCISFKIAKVFMCVLAVLAGMAFVQARAATPFVGIQIQGLSSIISTSLGLESSEGVLVRDIAYPGPASGSDVNRGDVIVELDGKAIKNVEEVVNYIESLSSGSKVHATVLRRGKRLDVSISIGAKPPAWDIKRNNFATISAIGITFASLTDKVRQRFKLGWSTRGIVVSLVDEEKAAGLDINVGDVVVQVNQRPVWKPTQIVGYLQKAKEENKEIVLLLIEGRDGFRFAMLPVPK